MTNAKHLLLAQSSMLENNSLLVSYPHPNFLEMIISGECDLAEMHCSNLLDGKVLPSVKHIRERFDRVISSYTKVTLMLIVNKFDIRDLI